MEEIEKLTVMEAQPHDERTTRRYIKAQPPNDSTTSHVNTARR
jgi:hypothetical protein